MRIEQSRPHDERLRLPDQVRHTIRRKHYNQHRAARVIALNPCLRASAGTWAL